METRYELSGEYAWDVYSTKTSTAYSCADEGGDDANCTMSTSDYFPYLNSTVI